MLADSWNNRALSYYDIGDLKNARQAWDEASIIDSHHAEAVYNSLVTSWREGTVADDEVVRRLEEVHTSHPTDWLDEYLLGLVHLERGDADAALAVLKDAAHQGAEDEDVLRVLQEAEEMHTEAGGLIKAVTPIEYEIEAVATFDNGRFALVGTSHTVTSKESSSPTLEFWDIDNCHLVHNFDGFHEHICSIDVGADGQTAVIGGDDGKIWLWEVSEGRRLSGLTCRGPKLGRIHSISIAPDGSRALCGGTKGVILWDIKERHLILSYGGNLSNITASTASWEDGHVLAGTWDGMLVRWDINSDQESWESTGQHVAVASLAYVPCRQFALCGRRDGTIDIFNVTTGERRGTLRGHTDQVSAMTVVADGAFVVSASHDHTLRYWEIPPNKEDPLGRCLRTLIGHRHQVSCAFGKAEKNLNLSGSVKAVSVGDISFLEHLSVVPGHPAVGV